LVALVLVGGSRVAGKGALLRDRCS
jgi:hypothetical protein